MKRVLSLVAAAQLCLATPSRAQSAGTLTENGVTMDVKGSVILLDPKEPSLLFYLLPFPPTPDDTGKLQAGQYWGVMRKKPSPDPQKWKTCPWSELRLDWQAAKAALGDARKAAVDLISYHVSAENSESVVDKAGTLSLTGVVREGEDVTLITKGSHLYTDGRGKKYEVAWDFKVQGKVLALKKE